MISVLRSSNKKEERYSCVHILRSANCFCFTMIVRHYSIFDSLILMELEFSYFHGEWLNLKFMNVLILVNSYGEPDSISTVMTDYIKAQLNTKGIESSVFSAAESGIPLIDTALNSPPENVKQMTDQFLTADLHFWLSPLYHGSITGGFKNCLDWLEITAHLPRPYLTDKVVGLICWADGSQALNGISTMENIAKSLRAWSVPYTLPIISKDFFEPPNTMNIAGEYKEKLDLLIQIAISRKVKVIDR